MQIEALLIWSRLLKQQINLYLVESKLLMTLKRQIAIYPFLDNN